MIINKKFLLSKKIYIIHVAVLVVVLIVTAVAYLRYWNVAIVNGKGISRISYIKAMQQQSGKEILNAMIDETLILNEGAKNNVVVDQKFIDNEIAKIEEQLKAQNQTLDAALLAYGMTKTDLEKQIKVKRIETMLSAPKTEITQAQIDEFLTTNKALLPTGKTKTELEALAKDQLTIQASQASATAWLEGLRQSAKIVYN